MGRRSERYTVEECLCLGMNDLKGVGLLKEEPGSFRIIQWTDFAGKEAGKIGCSLGGFKSLYLSLRLSYTVTNSVDETRDVDYRIALDTTPCNFGGQRYWFICPLTVNGRDCGRRVGKIYLPPNGIYFGCRHCYNLTYRSCKEHNSRVSRLMKLSPEELERLFGSKALA